MKKLLIIFFVACSALGSDTISVSNGVVQVALHNIQMRGTTNLVVTGTLNPDATGIYVMLQQGVYRRADGALWWDYYSGSEYQIYNTTYLAGYWKRISSSPTGTYSAVGGVTGTPVVVYGVYP